MSKKIGVTGGSGAAGSYVVTELLNKGFDVLVIDRVPPAGSGLSYQSVDLTDYSATENALRGCDGVVHFASNPEPDFDFVTGADRFRNNTLCTYNVFNAACALGMKKVVWASSETVWGFPFATNQPVQVPVHDHDSPQPQNSYAISKVMCETAAGHLHRLHGVTFVGMRLSNVLYDGGSHRDLYQKIPDYWDDLANRKFNLWSYIDARDAARFARMALESDFEGAESFIVAAADTIMRQTNAELMQAIFPGVPILPGTGPHDSLTSSAKAADQLGWKPRWSWRDVLEVNITDHSEIDQ